MSDPRKVTIRGVEYWRSAKEMSRKTEPVVWQVTWPDGAHSYYGRRPRDLAGCTAIPLYAALPPSDGER